jgi:hypothetical protein
MLLVSVGEHTNKEWDDLLKRCAELCGQLNDSNGYTLKDKMTEVTGVFSFVIRFMEHYGCSKEEICKLVMRTPKQPPHGVHVLHGNGFKIVFDNGLSEAEIFDAQVFRVESNRK